MKKLFALIIGLLVFAAPIYAASTDLTPTFDARVSQSTDNSSWATIRDGAGDARNIATADLYMVYIQEGSSSDYEEIARTGHIFDTSALSYFDDITAATYKVYGTGKQDNLNGGVTPTINAYAGNFVADNNVAQTDYANMGTTALCDTAITYAGWNTAGYNEFALNATGLAAIDVSNVTKLALREATYDVADSAPGSAGGGDISGFKMYQSENGSNEPTLSITYTPSNIASLASVDDVNVSLVGSVEAANIAAMSGVSVN